MREEVVAVAILVGLLALGGGFVVLVAVAVQREWRVVRTVRRHAASLWLFIALLSAASGGLLVYSEGTLWQLRASLNLVAASCCLVLAYLYSRATQ